MNEKLVTLNGNDVFTDSMVIANEVNKFECFCETLMNAIEYLKENNDKLYRCLLNYAVNGTEKTELLLEVASEISFDANMSPVSMELVKMYEEKSLQENGYFYPFMVNAVREMIVRNMIRRENNVSNKRIYAIQMSNGTTKIGIATNMERRISQIKSSSGMNIEKAIYTDIFKDAHKNEKELREKFKNHRENGEYFSIPFTDIEKEIMKIAKLEKINVFLL